ncbi:MAG: hypothetical protein HUK25_03345 [Treponema sp.]|nr:hypothetical protein [Treponema sp.]
MKTTNKLFAVISAAFLLASCSNFTGSDFSKKNSTDLYSNGGNVNADGSVKTYGTTKYAMKVSSTVQSSVSNADGKYDFTLSVTFSNDVDPSTISAIKVETMSAADANKAVNYTSVASEAKVSDTNKKVVEVKFTLDTNTEAFSVTVPNTVCATNGMKMDQDSDGVWNEQEDSYYKAFNAVSIIGVQKDPTLKLTDFIPSPSYKFVDPTSTDPDIGKFVIEYVIPDRGTLKASDFISDIASQLSNHIGIKLNYDDNTSSKILSLTFTEIRDDSNSKTTYKATYFNNDYQNVSDVSIYVVNADTWVIKDFCGTGMNVKYSLDNDKQPKKNIYFNFTPVNGWGMCLSGIEQTFGAKETKMLGLGTIPANTAYIKVRCNKIYDADKDNKPVYENLAVKVYDGSAYTETIPMARDSAFTHDIVYSCDIVLDATKINNINTNGLYIVGEEGDKASFTVVYKNY